ncbi:putative RNA-directed DNA polymerase [Tanacetum coccineum]|uniref:RNA-directed DNA polymerase n=1 Tax=Tanacetum coccineum TaxID=301880 RepID=A0ABQ5FZ71_9ASTR
MEHISDSFVYSLWGSDDVGFSFCPSIGASCGSLLMWKSSVFLNVSSWNGNHFSGATGRWIGVDEDLVFINIYAPRSSGLKTALWSELRNYINSHQAIWVLFGDFNSVRNSSERAGCIFVANEAHSFNNFIASAGLFEFQLGGRRFTRFNKEGSKMSKLDRFLVTHNFLDQWPSASVTALARTISDHCPILLKVELPDFGPKPFRIFNHWLGHSEFNDLIEYTWGARPFRGSADIILKNKIKHLKMAIKSWSINKTAENKFRKSDLLRCIEDWDLKAESGLLTDADCVAREAAMFELMQLDQVERNKLLQRSRVKWAVDGDENSRYFHASIKKRAVKHRINGLSWGGNWITFPDAIKEAAFSHFQERFKEPVYARPRFRSNLFRTLDSSDVDFLESNFSMEEIKQAVWSCSGHFARGCNPSFTVLIPKKGDPIEISDFRPISLIGCVYKVLAKLLSSRLEKVIHKIIGPNQTAFIAGRQILDGVLIANEIINYASRNDLKLLLFKADFEKAFDSVNWSFLLDIMSQMGFSAKWCSWIKGCLSSATVSILVNGSPSNEFKMERGLRQGDPLSPFLFLIVAEALQVSIIEACNKNLFKDASGLRVNLAKSKLYGIGVNSEEVNRAAVILNCGYDALPFIYLGLPVGMKMNRVESWSEVIDRFTNRLSSWKSKILSIGGRMTLTKAVLGSLPLFYFSIFRAPSKVLQNLEKIRSRIFWGFKEGSKGISWVKWSKVCSNKSVGGLGVGSLKSMNLGLLGKWRWRFLNEQEALWRKVISVLYDNDGGFHNISGAGLKKGIWDGILSSSVAIDDTGVAFSHSFIKKVSDGDTTLFWEDSWVAHGPCLKLRFPRLYALETNKEAKVKDRWMMSNGNGSSSWNWRSQPRGRALDELNSIHNLLNGAQITAGSPDRWFWNYDSKGMFTVKRLTSLINNHILNNDSSIPHHIWIPWVPIKVNICVWRAAIDRVPTYPNLARRGVALASTICPLCKMEEEFVSHRFITCSFSNSIWKKLESWWKITLPPAFDLNAIARNTVVSGGGNGSIAKAFHGVCFILIWSIWKWRNCYVHAAEDQKPNILAEDIFSQAQRYSLLWIANRSSMATNDWGAWIANPSRVVSSANKYSMLQTYDENEGTEVTEARNRQLGISGVAATAIANEVIRMDVNVSNKGSWNLAIQVFIWSSTQQLGI